MEENNPARVQTLMFSVCMQHIRALTRITLYLAIGVGGVAIAQLWHVWMSH